MQITRRHALLGATAATAALTALTVAKSTSSQLLVDLAHPGDEEPLIAMDRERRSLIAQAGRYCSAAGKASTAGDRAEYLRLAGFEPTRLPSRNSSGRQDIATGEVEDVDPDEGKN